MASGMANAHTMKKKVVLESDLRGERAEWLKTQLEGHEGHTKWKIKCRSVYEAIAIKYPSVNPVEAGKIVKKAFPFVKRQNYHPRNGSSESYYYSIRKIYKPEEVASTKQGKETNLPHEKEALNQLRKCVAEKEEVIGSKVKKLKRLERNYNDSLESIRRLQKQKKTLSQIVNDLEEQRLKQQSVHSMATVNPQQNEVDDIISRLTEIPVDHLIPLQTPRSTEASIIIGSGSYGACELMSWKNIHVCVKKAHSTTDISGVKKEAAILHQLQQSLFVPVLLGIHLSSTPYCIVTKFHSVRPESSVTLHKAIHSSAIIQQNKWMNILIKCGTGIKSIHNFGILHNDLHQKNVILDKMHGHTHPIIIDFGKACKIGNGRCRNVQNFNAYRDQHPWIAPETISGKHEESKASDIFGFGYIISRVNSKLGCGSLKELSEHCQSKRDIRPTIDNIITSLQNMMIS